MTVAKDKNNFPRTFDIYRPDGSVEQVIFKSIEELIDSLINHPQEPHHVV